MIDSESALASAAFVCGGCDIVDNDRGRATGWNVTTAYSDPILIILDILLVIRLVYFVKCRSSSALNMPVHPIFGALGIRVTA